MVGKNTHQVQLGEKQWNCFTYKNDQIWKMFSFKPQNGLSADVVRNLEGCRDTASYCRTYSGRDAATVANAARYISACTH